MRSALVFVSLLSTSLAFSQDESALTWESLPNLPDPIGVAGSFGGAIGSDLIVVGGANFPVAPPWEGGQKVWHAEAYVFSSGAWFTDLQIDRPLAYGVTIPVEGGLLLIGGQDSARAYSDVRFLTWERSSTDIPENRLTIDLGKYPALPQPAAYHAGAKIGDVVYILGGITTNESSSAVNKLWSLDLSNPNQGWTELASYPGPPRIKTVFAAQSSGLSETHLYMFSGESTAEDGSLVYHDDAYRYNPIDDSWEEVTGPQKPVAAGSAVAVGQSHILVFSGSTGEGVDLPVQDRPTFPNDVFAYHTITDTWVKIGEMPTAVVTTALAEWNGKHVIVSGEIKPGVRTPIVQSFELSAEASHFQALDWTVLFLYLLATVGVGVFFSRREKTTGDFFLAGKRIPWWAAGLSIYATQLSAITFVASPSVSYAGNWLVWPTVLTITLIAPIVIVFYLPFFRGLNVTTAYEYLEKRFSLAVRLVGSVSFVLFQIGRMAIVLFLPSIALAAITGLDIYLCIALVGVLAMLYTVLGGMEAVIWTDVVQTFVLLGGIIFALFVVFTNVGGVGEAWTTATSNGKLQMTDWSMSASEMTTWAVIIGVFFLNFGPYTADQAVVQRYLTTKDESSAAKGIWLNGILAVPGTILFFGLGTALYVFYKANPGSLTVGMDNDQIFPLFIASQLPIGVSGLVIAGIFAASMSSLDSSMHSIATVVTTDLYGRLRKRATDIEKLNIAKWTILVMGLVAVAAASMIAAMDIQSLFVAFQKVLGLMTAGLVGSFMLGIFTQRANAAGVLTGVFSSALVLFFVTNYTSLNGFLYGVVGIAVCVVIGYWVSCATGGEEKELAGLTWKTK